MLNIYYMSNKESLMNTRLEMEQILNYLAKLAHALLSNGSTLEHVEYAIEKNADSVSVN